MRVIVVHGFQGNPEGGWKPWLKKELEAGGFEVSVPAMPNPNEPIKEEWVAAIAREVGKGGSGTYLVGHSLGCIAILRFLESCKIKVGGAVLVAGFADGLGGEFDILRGFLEPRLDFEKVREACQRMTAIFSDNDPYIPLSQERLFREKLGAKTMVLHSRGHFSSSEGCTKLPEALDALLRISSGEP